MSTFPKVVALDTDWTIWQNYLDQRYWGKGRNALKVQKDNIDRADRHLLRDRTNHNRWIRVYNDVSRIVNDILKNGAQLAIVTRNPAKELSDRALYYFNTINPADNKEWSIIHLVKYDEVHNESKTKPFRRIEGWSSNDYVDMILFDDEAANNDVKVVLGATFQLCRNKKGLTWENYQHGINTWRRSKHISMLKEPSSARRRVLIGYSGLPANWINLVRIREGIVDPKIPYRWGYALYVTESMTIARYFSNWNNQFTKERSNVCEVWVKDYDMWCSINKIWVPEHSTAVPMMNNMNWNAENTGLNQENRDLTVSQKWNVHAPYVLFSQHFYMAGMPPPRSKRWHEMVVYTEIRRALFEVVPLNDNQLNAITNPVPMPFGKQFKTWNITAPPDTRREFQRYKEMDLYNASA